MNDQIKQIAERLRGLRDVLELTSEDRISPATVTFLLKSTDSQKLENTIFLSVCCRK